MQRGLVQRVTALNRFIEDVYHGQEIVRAGRVPADQILKNAQFRPEMMGVTVRAASTRISPGSTSSAPPTPTAAAATTCSRTTCACRAA